MVVHCICHNFGRYVFFNMYSIYIYFETNILHAYIYLYTYTSQHATENQGEAIGYGMQYEVFPDLGVSLAKEIYKTRPDDPHATLMLLYFTTPWLYWKDHKITKQEQLFLKENGYVAIHFVLSYISFVSFYNIY